MLKKFEKGSLERDMFGEVWDIAQRYWIPEDDENYWNALIKETDDFNAKYKALRPLSNQIIVGLLTGLQQKYEESKR